jgi:integrase
VSLTERTLKTAKPKSSVYRIRDVSADQTLKGFGATVAPNGAISFFLSFTDPATGKRKQFGLGKYSSTSLKEAREKARDARRLIDNGITPTDQKAKLLGRGTVADLFACYVQGLEMDGKVSAQEVGRVFEKDIEPFIGSKYTADVSTEDILDVLTVITRRGKLVHANRVRGYLHAAFNLGLHIKGDTRWRDSAPEFGLNVNPVTKTRKPTKDRVGNRTLSVSELKILCESKRFSAPSLLALKMMIATGQRVEEVLHAEWAEFDLNRLDADGHSQPLWYIPSSRRGKTADLTSEPHVVPLPSFHVKLLEEIKETSVHEKWLFPHKDGQQPRKHDALYQAVVRFCRNAGFESFSPRDLRRTWKTLAGSIGIDLEIRNRIQGHAMTDVGSIHYDRWNYLPEKYSAMERWADWLSSLIENE